MAVYWVLRRHDFSLSGNLTYLLSLVQTSRIAVRSHDLLIGRQFEPVNQNRGLCSYREALEIRIDKTAGDVSASRPGGGAGQNYVRLTNAIESPVRIDRLAAAARVGDKVLPLRVDGFTPASGFCPARRSTLCLLARNRSQPLAPRPS